MRAKGIDISHWQGTFQNKGNLDFLIIKATEGEDWVDPEYDLFTEEGITVPIRGAYHYFRTEYDGVLQAQHFFDTVKDKGFHFLAVDYEAKFNDLDADGEGELQDFWEHLSALTELPVLLYTSPYVYRDSLCHFSTFWLNVPIWMAHYNDLDPQVDSPKLFDALGWKLWQWTSSYNGTYYGVGSENVDQNVYNGTVEEMKKWLSIGGTTVNKNWFSKTTAFSILFILVNIAGIWGYGEFTPSPELVQYAGIAVSVIGAIVGVVVKYFENKD